MKKEYDFSNSVQNPYAKKFDDIVESSWLNSLAKLIKKFKSSKSYWSVSSIVILFTIREALAWKWGSAIEAYAQKQLEGTDYGWWWTAIEFVFGIGGSWELVALGVGYFIILSYVKVNSAEKDEIVKVVKEESNKTHDKLDELTKLFKLHGIRENEFLEKYFGKDYAIILQNPQTYHNFTTLLKQTNKTADELLKEREELLKKIESQSFSPKLQAQIDKSFKELRYEDTRELLDAFLEANADKEKEIIKAHYIKALTYIEQIRYHEAKEEFEKIAPNIDDANILHEYGRLYDILGEYDRALEYYNKSLKIKLSTLGKNHLNTAITYNTMGVAFRKKHQYDKALDSYEKALNIRLSILGENDTATATTYNNIAVVWRNKFQHDKALINYKKSLKICLNIFGENNSDTATTYNNIGSVWAAKEKYNKALEYYEKALKIRLTVFQKNHPSIADSYCNISSMYFMKKEYKKAIEYNEKSLKIRLSVFGENHPDIAENYILIGEEWYRKGKYKKAMEYYKKSLNILEIVFPTGHPNIDMTKEILENIKKESY